MFAVISSKGTWDIHGFNLSKPQESGQWSRGSLHPVHHVHHHHGCGTLPSERVDFPDGMEAMYHVFFSCKIRWQVLFFFFLVSITCDSFLPVSQNIRKNFRDVGLNRPKWTKVTCAICETIPETWREWCGVKVWWLVALDEEIPKFAPAAQK